MAAGNWLLKVGVAVFCVVLGSLDRAFLKKNHGFCVHYVLPSGSLPYPESWKSQGEIPGDVLEQTFSYLTKGSQTYVFLSEDGNYVLKLYKLPSHMRRIPWLKHPLGYLVQQKRHAAKDHNLKRWRLSWESYLIAQKLLPHETEVAYVHPRPDEQTGSLHLVDRLGASYTLPANSLPFLLQKRVDPLFTVLDRAKHQNDLPLGQTIVDSLLQSIVSRCRQGIADLDWMIHLNYGWFEGRAVLIDTGRLVPDPRMKEPSAYRKEVQKMTQLLDQKLKAEWPDLHVYYISKVEEI